MITGLAGGTVRSVKYYYAGGKRVQLEPDPTHVVVDTNVAGDVAQGVPLAGGLVLIDKGQLSAELQRRLRASGALDNAYRHGQVVAVPIPEVRVELDSEEQRKRAKSALERAAIPFEVVSDEPERMVLRPSSGNDAIDLANYVYEQAQPASASPRLVQITPRPEPRRR